MQVRTSDGWHELEVKARPLQLSGQLALDVIWDETSPAFREVMNASQERRQVRFRASEQEPAHPFWVMFNRVRDVRTGVPDTSRMLLTETGWHGR